MNGGGGSVLVFAVYAHKSLLLFLYQDVERLFQRTKVPVSLEAVELYNTGTEGICAVLVMSSGEDVSNAMTDLQGSIFPNSSSPICFVEYDEAFHETLKNAYEYVGGGEKKSERGNGASSRLANLEKLKVSELREELDKRGHETRGTKAVLVKKLKNLIAIEEAAINNLPPPITHVHSPDEGTDYRRWDSLSGRPNSGNDRDATTSHHASDTITCPFDYSDYVFGASFQGRTQMEYDTGAKIYVDTKFDPYLVKISGRRECVDRAKEIVVKMMKECEENAQARTPPLTERLDCPKIHIGAIIGLKGSVVKSIEDDTGTKIDIFDQRDPCKIDITGKRECVDRAKEIVMKLMKDAAESVIETLDCPKIHIGAIIGPKGSVVNRTQKDTGAKVNILDECDPCKVNITGKRECVDRAKEIVMKLMKDAAEQLRLNRGFHAHGREKKTNGDLRRRIQAAPKSSSKSRNSPTKLKVSLFPPPLSSSSSTSFLTD